MRAAMGKSVGTKPSGKGPGMQKRMTSQRKYLVSDKNKVKKGSMADLDFGVEQAPKLSKAEQETGLKGKTAAPAARPAPALRARVEGSSFDISTPTIIARFQVF